ncbi:MAG: GntR family transcriptional regulator [Draconibacterium sp.]|nr:GntR family transcriptional regulator [Draconibacterium sp.]
MTELKYIAVRNFLKEQIQQGTFGVGDFLPSENELCRKFSITRTTARKALDELLKEGFIEKKHGKGSCVIERRKSLGLLTVKGFSEAVGKNVKTIFLQKQVLRRWESVDSFFLKDKDTKTDYWFFERLRYVGNNPVIIEKTWVSTTQLPGFKDVSFIDNSFFKTLSQKYFIEIIGSSQELRAEFAKKKVAKILQIETHSPILHISVQFKTSVSNLTIYSELYCNTKKFPIENNYYI